MEKHQIDAEVSIVENDKQIEAQTAEHSRSHTVKRKPVAATTTPTPNAELSDASHPPPGYDYVPGAQASAPSSKRPLVTRLRTRWSLYSRRTRVIFIASILVLLALIIGLSAGLSARKSRVKNLPLPSNHGGPYTGDLTYYDPALGACGITSTSSDAICAVSHIIFDAVSTGSNPNANPLCGKKIRVKRNDKSVDLTVVDRCVGCQSTDIDTTRSVFAELATIDEGRVLCDWSWLDGVPSGANS